MKKYRLGCIYRNIQIFKTCFCKTDIEAAKKLNVSLYTIKKYAGKINVNKIDYDEIYAFMDSGKIIFQHNRFDLMNKEMPLNKLQNIIDTYQDSAYLKFKQDFKI